MITDKTRKYFYDLCSVANKKIIELHGDFWHANPKYFTENQYANHPGGKILSKNLWDKDMKKTLVANQHGFNVMVVWESDYKLSPHDTVNKIITFLGS
jgi:G:T-mismatch repair DNA endonuclease (very short patch repair protein)